MKGAVKVRSLQNLVVMGKACPLQIGLQLVKLLEAMSAQLILSANFVDQI
jgi:hypothetical protein